MVISLQILSVMVRASNNLDRQAFTFKALNSDCLISKCYFALKQMPLENRLVNNKTLIVPISDRLGRTCFDRELMMI